MRTKIVSTKGNMELSVEIYFCCETLADYVGGRDIKLQRNQELDAGAVQGLLNIIDEYNFSFCPFCGVKDPLQFTELESLR